MASKVDVPDDETADLIERLARQTARSPAELVRDAVLQEEARLERARQVEARLAGLKLALQRLKPEPPYGSVMTHKEADAWMYDENGLPH